MNLTLIRHAYLPDVTLGTIQVGLQKFYTLEEPWRKDVDGPGGMSNISCVPDGTYDLVPHDGKIKDVFALQNASLGVWHQKPQGSSPQWGRSAILIHAGNTVDDIEGCILLGLDTRIYGNRHRVDRSQEALVYWRSLVPRVAGHTLTIRAIKGTVER